MRRKISIMLAALIAVACADVATVPQEIDPWALGDLGPSLSVISGLPAVCGDVTTTRLIADETVPVGTVEVTQSSDNLYVTYETDPGWPILKTSLFIGSSASEIPTNRTGNPRVGKFPYKANHLEGPNSVVWEIPLGSLSPTDIVVAAFAQVGETLEGAWAEGEMISPGGNWSMYLRHTGEGCAAQTVDETGGTVSIPDESASIQIPAGALMLPVDITIDPSTVEELVEHVQGEATANSVVAATSGPESASSITADGQEVVTGAGGTTVSANIEDFPTVNGTVPIEGTVWKFGPDGTEFATPATVTLSYEDAWIPVDVDEADLRIFLLNGIFDSPVSTVDPTLNIVSAQIAHFSFAYIGFVPDQEADLAVISATESADPILVGESVTYQATIENFGPYLFPVAGVAYQAFGDVVAGALAPGCVEVVAPLFADVQIDCTIGTLSSVGQFFAPPATFVAQSEDNVTIWMDPFSSNSTDPNLPNNRLTDDVTVNVGELADLAVISATESADPILVGESVTYQATIENFGPYLFPVAGVAYQAFGDVVAGVLAPGCVEVAAPLFADVQIDCTIGTLSSVGQFFAPPATFVAQSEDNVTIWMDPFSSNSTDPNLPNNRLTDDVTVNVGELADLAVISATESADPILVGESVTYQATIENFGPYLFPVVGVAYQAFGDVVAGTLAPGCVEVDAPLFADVQIDCTIGTLSSVGQFFAPPATFDAQSDGNVTIWMDPLSSNSTDPNLPNNRLTDDVTVNAEELADLAVISATESADPILVGESVTYQATIESFGPYLFPVVGVAYQAFGDVVAGTLAPGCVEVDAPLFADVQIDCTIGTLPSVGQFFAPPATFVAQRDGNVTIWMDPFSSNSTDPNLPNNRLTDDVTINIGGPSSIAFGDIIEDVTTTPGDTTWYSFEGVPGGMARVQLWITEDLNHSIQLVVKDPGGTEIYPAGLSRGRATDNSSANTVFGTFPGTYRIGLQTFGTGPYRLGLGTGEGRLDLSYGTAGVAYGPNTGDAEPFVDWEWVGDQITVLGERTMVRFDGDGSMVGAFGTSGVVDVNTELGPGRWGQALAIQPDGMIVVAARQLISPYPWIVARFDASGALDPTFGTGGITEVPMGTRSSSRPIGVGFQQNGADLDIIVGGEVGELMERVGILRFNPDGTLDTGFGGGDGIVFESRGMTPRKMALQSDGSILMHGWDDLLRYTPSGVLDTTFGVGGVVDYAIPGNAMGINVLPDDRLMVTGLDIGNAFVMRLTADGARDASFSGGGYQAYDFGFTSERFESVALDGTGGLIAVGHMRLPGGDYEWLVSRMSVDGVLDPDFAISGYLTEARTDNAMAVRVDSAGRIVVGGQAENSARGIELTRHIPN